ncbi:MAG: hypothetical protein WC494_02530 [Candidatus Pacearchaeota archaeon]
MKMDYKELRNFLQNLEKYPKCKKYPRAPLIHEGFPGTFNLSFTEYDMLREFSGYHIFPKDQIFSSIQTCVRPQDIIDNIKEGKDLWKYLGVFEMSDVAGIIVLSKKEDIKKVHGFQIRKLIETLEKLGLDKKKIFPSFQAGGKVSEITEGKYNFNFEIPEDSFTKQKFIELGIPEQNLIPDKTRNTLLSLHLHRPTPWGYRNEINYNIGTKENPKFLDIGTLEYFVWLPTYSSEEKVSKNINGLKSFDHVVSIGAFGVERLYMAINHLKNVYDVDYIKKFYNSFKKLYNSLTEEQRIKAGEVIRALHRIFADVSNLNIKVGYQQNKKVKYFLQVLIENLKEFDEKKLKTLLKENSKAQPWHKNLNTGIKPTIERIRQYYFSEGRLRVERSTKPEKHQKKKLAP